jgi:hypothetical protein
VELARPRYTSRVKSSRLISALPGLTALFVSVAPLHAAPAPADLVRSLLDAAGGEAKVLRLFRFKESLVVGKAPAKTRESIAQPPDHWWVGQRDRVLEESEPAAFLVWAWTLAPLLDDKSTLEIVPDAEHEGRPAIGIRVSGRTEKPMVLVFDAGTKRLARVDWRGDRNVFSDWRQLDGLWYAAKVAGYKADGRQWYHTELLEVERLTDLPAHLRAKP